MESKYRWRWVTFSALGRAVWDETIGQDDFEILRSLLSVLSVEPYGMKHRKLMGRLVLSLLSVLSVEPYGMKLVAQFREAKEREAFSALGRAVWDETYFLRF